GLPGYFMDPTIIAEAQAGMPLVDEEQFGSALPIITYDDVDSTIDQINAGQYGLGASIWSQDLERAKRYANRLESGTVSINQHTARARGAPFGGWNTTRLDGKLGR